MKIIGWGLIVFFVFVGLTLAFTVSNYKLQVVGIGLSLGGVFVGLMYRQMIKDKALFSER